MIRYWTIYVIIEKNVYLNVFFIKYIWLKNRKLIDFDEHFKDCSYKIQEDLDVRLDHLFSTHIGWLICKKLF